MKKLLFSALMGAMIISCNRDNDNVSPAPTIDDPSILPTKFTYFIPGDDEEVITFSYDENKLVKLTQNNEDIIFTYTGDLITSVRSDINTLSLAMMLMEISYLNMKNFITTVLKLMKKTQHIPSMVLL